MMFIEYFDKGVERYPDRVFATGAGPTLTFSEMRALTHRIASGLVGEGLSAQSVVATYAQNDVLTLAAQLGVMRAGLIWLPINTRNSRHENAAIIESFGAEFVLFHSAQAEEVRPILQRNSGVKAGVCLDRGTEFAPSLEAWLAGHPARACYFAKESDDIASLPATSGTTAVSKGVMLTHGNWEAMVANYQMLMRYDTPPVTLVAAPLTHAAGYFAATLISIGNSYVIHAKPDPLAILQAIETHKVTTLFLPPTLVYMLLAHPRVHDFDYSSLRYMIYGGAPMSVEKLKEAIEVFGPVMAQHYGQTEAPVVLGFLDPRDHVEALADLRLRGRLASTGREGPLLKVGIMDDEDRLQPPGAHGEIVVRGSAVMKGYWRNPEATAEVSRGGWHHTGDIGFKDVDGFLYVVDRKKDMIITGGFNVYPSEVEQVIWAHPAIQDCAVVGIPDEKWGEAVTAVVELKDGAALDVAALIRDCKERIGGVKAPKTIEVWQSLPRSATGKVLKREIRAQFWKGRDGVI